MTIPDPESELLAELDEDELLDDAVDDEIPANGDEELAEEVDPGVEI